jgi:hypothetical protein
MKKFKITKFNEETLGLVKEEFYDPPIEGLPPSHSQMILIEPNDIATLMEVLKDYGN